MKQFLRFHFINNAYYACESQCLRATDFNIKILFFFLRIYNKIKQKLHITDWQDLWRNKLYDVHIGSVRCVAIMINNKLEVFYFDSIMGIHIYHLKVENSGKKLVYLKYVGNFERCFLLYFEC